MIKIVSFKICPFVQRVTALLEAKEIAYDIEYIDLSNKPQWFLDISPNGQVPILIAENGQALFESEAIIEYIDDVYTPLEPKLSAENKAIDRAWSYQASKLYLPQCSAQRSTDQATLSERSVALNKAFAKVENTLGEGHFFKGETVSNVDIAWLPLLHRASIIHQKSTYDFLADFPKIKRWQKLLLATGLAEKSVSDDFEEKFGNFYLSGSTALGNQNIFANDVPAIPQPACC